MIMCYEVGRDRVTGVEQVEIPPLTRIRELYETMASIHQPCAVIGVAMNSRRITAEQAADERKRQEDELGLPVCDVFRHGADSLLDAIEASQRKHLASLAT